MRVWSVLLTDEEGGWVMGVFPTRDDALARLREYEATDGGAEMGEPIHHHDTMSEIPILNATTGSRFLIVAHTLGVCDP